PPARQASIRTCTHPHPDDTRHRAQQTPSRARRYATPAEHCATRPHPPRAALRNPHPPSAALHGRIAETSVESAFGIAGVAEVSVYRYAFEIGETRQITRRGEDRKSTRLN